MSDHVVTVEQLRRGSLAPTTGRAAASQELHRILGDVYCDRPPTTADKCRAVAPWRQDAVLSHFTAAWQKLHVALCESYAADRVVL